MSAFVRLKQKNEVSIESLPRRSFSSPTSSSTGKEKEKRELTWSFLFGSMAVLANFKALSTGGALRILGPIYTRHRSFIELSSNFS